MTGPVAYFAHSTAELWRRGSSGWERKPILAFPITAPMPLEADLATAYPQLRSAARAFEAYVPMPDLAADEGDKVVYLTGPGAGREFILVALERWDDRPPHLRLVMEER